MSAWSATLGLDVRIQARSKLYLLGVLVALLFGLAGRFAFDAQHAGRVLAVFYLVGLGSTTYMFGASLVLFDKSQGTLQALRVTPLPARIYIASKAITLSAFATLESAIVYALAFFAAPLDPAPMILGVVVLAIFSTLVGLGQVSSHDSVTSFLFPGAMLVTLVLELPALSVLDVGPPWLWYLIPTQGPLLFMLAASEPLAAWQWAYAIGISLAALALTGWWAKRRFARSIALQEG